MSFGLKLNQPVHLRGAKKCQGEGGVGGETSTLYKIEEVIGAPH